MVINGLKILSPNHLDDTTTSLIIGLVSWQGNISKIRGKTVKAVGNSMWNKAEAMLNGLKTPPLEDLDKILRETVTCLVKWNKKVSKFNKEKRDNDEDSRPNE